MKTNETNIAMAGLMPHAPVLIPEVAAGRLGEVQASVDSMRQLSRKVLARQPTRLVLISPHAPRQPGAFGIWQGTRLQGSLDRFGHPEVGVSLPNDLEMGGAIFQEGERNGLGLWRIGEDQPLDHGAVVPLYFLTEAGWSGPTTVLSLNYPGEGGLESMGEVIASAAVSVGGVVAVMASGDMSHRLKEGAPAGYHPRAGDFDEAFVQVVRSGAYQGLKELDPGLVELAAEDVVDSTRIAVSAAGLKSRHHDVLSYEGPFGVGYCVALLHEANGHDHPQT